MGQERPVQVYLLASDEETIEEKLLATRSAKHELALAALDMEADVDEVALASGVEELKWRLEVQTLNADWTGHARPLVEFALHCEYFLKQLVRYDAEDFAPLARLPSGVAALLCLYGLR
jgi:hypothetical protein